jgi:peptide deformylase
MADLTEDQRRDEVVQQAKEVVRAANKLIPEGSRVVVVVADEEGAFVGVAANTIGVDVAMILACALDGTKRRDHNPRVVDMVVDEDGSIRCLVSGGDHG